MIYFKYLRGASFGSIFRSEYKIKILSSEIYQGYSTHAGPDLDGPLAAPDLPMMV